MWYWRCARKVHSAFTFLNWPLDLLICGTAGSPALESDNERLARAVDEQGVVEWGVEERPTGDGAGASADY